MAVSLATYSGDGIALESRVRDTPNLSIDRSALKTRMQALVEFWESLKSSGVRETKLRNPNIDQKGPDTVYKHDIVQRDLFRPCQQPTPDHESPPSYQDSISDAPPDYTATDALASSHTYHDANIPSADSLYRKPSVVEPPSLHSVWDVKVDLSTTDHIRTHMGKKAAKKAAKAAQAAKWEDSDNDENKDGIDGGSGGDGNGTGGGGAGSGGDGGGADPPGGDGGDDEDDWWNTGAGGKKKDKKKKKKNAWEEFEEEEEKEAKKAEEEAATSGGAAEADADPLDDWGAFATVGKKGKKKKGKAELEPLPEPEAAAEAPAAADAGGEDDWAGFLTTTKKKKGKKGKDPEPEPEPEAQALKDAEADPIMDSIDLGASANADDAWGSFATVGKKKKGKKGKDEAVAEPDIDLLPPPAPEPAADDGDDWMSFGKKGKKDKKKTKNEPAPEATKDIPNDMRFDDINLNDDKTAPKLDLDFGLGKKSEAAEPKSGGFSFGGWGSWGFGGSSDPPAETKQEDTSWGFTSIAKKDKDKKKSGAFDFNFDNVAGDIGGDILDFSAPAAKEPPKVEDDPWDNFTSKKDKKVKKKGAVDPAVDVPPPPPPVEEKAFEDDPWAGISTKKDKKTKKKGAFAWDPEPEPAPEPIVVVPEMEPAKEEDDIWSAFGNDKKKGVKKATKAEPAMQVTSVPDPVPEPISAPDDAFEGWGLSTKKTKKGKKGQPEPEPIVEPAPPPPEEKPSQDDPWASFGSKDKKKKKGGFSFDWAGEPTDPVLDMPSPPPAAAPDPADDWMGGGWADTTTKKAKKGKKGVVEEVPPPPPALDVVADEPAAEEDWFGGFGAAKKDKTKKGKSDLIKAVPATAVLDNTFLTPEAVVEPKADDDDDWANSWSTGTKKKATKKDKSKGIVEVNEPSPGASVLLPESVQEKSAEEDPWANWTTGKKAKAKTTKKSAFEPMPPAIQSLADFDIEPSADVSAGADLLDIDEAPADDPWSFSTSTKKKGKTDKKGSKVVEAPKVEEVKLTKTKSKETKAPADDFFNIVEEANPALEPEPPKKEKKDDKKEKASSAWGGIWGGSTATATTATVTKKETPRERREREKKEREEREAAEAEAQRQAEEDAFAAALGDDPNDILDSEDEAPAPAPAPAKKSSTSKDKDAKDGKKKGSEKLAKVDSKTSKKSEPKEAEPIVEPDLEFEPVPVEAPVKADGWGFWGAPAKSSKKATPVAATGASGRKIAPDPWTNQDASLTGLPKMPDLSFGNDMLESAISPPKSAAAASSKSKGVVKGASIQDRIKALQGEPVVDAKPSKSKKGASVPPPPPPEPEYDPEPEPEPLFDLPAAPPVLDKKAKKTSTATKSLKKDKKDVSSLADPVPPPQSVSPVPGGFPIDDFLSTGIAPAPSMPPSPPKKSSTKDKKPPGKSTKKESSSKAEPVVGSPSGDLLGGEYDDPLELPTPPEEEDASKEKKSTKKERPKVVRDQASTSWGFWGATPSKKPSKKEKDKDSKDGTVSPTTKVSPAGLVRSKSARKASDKDPLEKASKSSGSDKDGKKEARSRPSTSRGMGFSMFGMGTAPSRSKSTRQSSSAAKNSSRRQSSAVEDSGLLSPPPEEKLMSSKAANVMGVGRSKSMREKGSRKVPDPYALDDDDDLVMVDGPEDSAKDIEEFKGKKKSSKSTRQSSNMSGGLGAAGDEIDVDAPLRSEEGKAVSGPDDLAFAERPSPVRRATSSAKRNGLMGGLFGAFAARPAPDRRSSKAYESEDPAARRKRSSGYDNDQTKRLRREDRTVNQSRKTSAGDGLTDAEDPEAREARRRERRERREREAAEEEAKGASRRARAREEEERLMREEDEREARRKEERRARRAEKEALRAEEDRLTREEEKAREERRERRRERERQRVEEEAAAATRQKTDRRRSYMDSPDNDEARRMRREEHRMRRSVDQSADKERPRTSRRRSDYPAPVDGEQDPHTGAFSPIAHAIKTGGDKTASWVQFLNQEPPPPPPVEGTIVDAPLHFAEDNTPDPLGETTAREFRSRRRKEREDEDSERRRRRREEGLARSSDGSSRDRRRSYGPSNSLGYDGMGARMFDGRPAMAPKRGSWLKKIAGL